MPNRKMVIEHLSGNILDRRTNRTLTPFHKGKHALKRFPNICQKIDHIYILKTPQKQELKKGDHWSL